MPKIMLKYSPNGRWRLGRPLKRLVHESDTGLSTRNSWHDDDYENHDDRVCPTRYRTRHFFNNSNTNEDIATEFEHGYVRCVRNEEECVCSAPNCCDTEQRSASQPGSVASGTPYIFLAEKLKTISASFNA
jgi:hypothetical protein